MATKKKEPATAKHQVPIDQVMAAVDLRKKKYYENLSDEDRRAVNTYMAQRWASQVQGSRDIQEHYLLMANDLSNIDFVATTSGHEELRWQVLSLIGLGQKLRHEFIPPKGQKKDRLSEWLIELFPHLGEEEIELFRTINDGDVLKEAAESMNIADKKLKELFK
jgi:predicted ABC-class ATPase